MRAWRWAVCAILFGVSPAFGGEPSAPSKEAPTSASKDEQRAVELFEQGRALYREGKLAESVAALRQAYALKPVAVLQYNIARAEEGLGNYDAAIAAYEAYLTDEKDIPDRGAIEQKLASLKKDRDERARLAKERDEARQAKSQAPTSVAPASAGPSPAPWIVGGAGVLVVGVGGLLAGLAVAKNDDAEAAPNQLDALDLRAGAESFQTAALITMIGGGAVAGAGLIWGIVDVTSSGPGTPAVGVRVGPTGLSIEGRF